MVEIEEREVDISVEHGGVRWLFSGCDSVGSKPDQNGSGMRKTFATYGKDFVMKILSIVFLA